MMNGNFNHFVAAEQVKDMHRAAERSRQAAELRTPRTREASKPSISTTRSVLSLRRRPKVA